MGVQVHSLALYGAVLQGKKATRLMCILLFIIYVNSVNLTYIGYL